MSEPGFEKLCAVLPQELADFVRTAHRVLPDAPISATLSLNSWPRVEVRHNGYVLHVSHGPLGPTKWGINTPGLCWLVGMREGDPLDGLASLGVEVER